MSSNDKQLIAVIGATGLQGGSVVRALQTSGRFKVRALTRDPGRHRGLAEEVVEADLNRPETLKAAFRGAHGVFLVTNFWEKEKKNNELEQATAAVHAAKDAGVKHFVWSTLPNVEAISGGKFRVPHFTGKAKVDKIVHEAGFENHTFVIAPGYDGTAKAGRRICGLGSSDRSICALHAHGRHWRTRQHRCRSICTSGSGRQRRVSASRRRFDELQPNYRHAQQAGTQIFIQASARGGFRCLFSRRRGNRSDVWLHASSYLFGLRF
jgi:hypothetical protein